MAGGVAVPGVGASTGGRVVSVELADFGDVMTAHVRGADPAAPALAAATRTASGWTVVCGDCADVVDVRATKPEAKQRLREVAGLAAERLAAAAAARAERGAAGRPVGPGPADDELVWVAAARVGVEMHRIDPAIARLTPCGRNRADYGYTVSAGEANQRYGSKPCRRCWPTVDGAR